MDGVSYLRALVAEYSVDDGVRDEDVLAVSRFLVWCEGRCLERMRYTVDRRGEVEVVDG